MKVAKFRLDGARRLLGRENFASRFSPRRVSHTSSGPQYFTVTKTRRSSRASRATTMIYRRERVFPKQKLECKRAYIRITERRDGQGITIGNVWAMSGGETARTILLGPSENDTLRDSCCGRKQ